MRIVVQYALLRATNLSEVLLCYLKKKKKLLLSEFTDSIIILWGLHVKLCGFKVLVICVQVLGFLI